MSRHKTSIAAPQPRGTDDYSKRNLVDWPSVSASATLRHARVVHIATLLGAASCCTAITASSSTRSRRTARRESPDVAQRERVARSRTAGTAARDSRACSCGAVFPSISGTGRESAARTGAAPTPHTHRRSARTSATSRRGASARLIRSGSTACSSRRTIPRPGTRRRAAVTRVRYRRERAARVGRGG